MKSRYQLLLIFGVLSITEFSCRNTLADEPQVTLDAGINIGKSMMGDVIDASKNTDVNSIPGFAGTDLPQTKYYTHQDLNGLQTDAMVDINTGNANEASQFAYQKSLQPKLQFSPDDPMLVKANEVGENAALNPDILTVPAGNCNVVDVGVDETRLETCTSWLQPTQQTCNKTLDVDVTWENISSCPIATSFSQVQALHNASGTNDYVYARAYCNPGAGEDMVSMQFKASDGDSGDCTDWVGIDASTNQTNQVYSGALLRPQFHKKNTCINVPAFIQGGCDADNQCLYTVTYHELGNWTQYADADPFCYGSPMNLNALGYSGPGDTYSTFLNNSPQEGYYCVIRSSSVEISFERPHITQEPTVTDTWNDGCGLLEAQVQ